MNGGCFEECLWVYMYVSWPELGVFVARERGMFCGMFVGVVGLWLLKISKRVCLNLLIVDGFSLWPKFLIALWIVWLSKYDLYGDRIEIQSYDLVFYIRN